MPDSKVLTRVLEQEDVGPYDPDTSIALEASPTVAPIFGIKAYREIRQQGTQWVLPSGLVASLRVVGLLDLIDQGAIPAGLTAMVEDFLAKDNMQLSLDQFKEFADAVNIICVAAFCDPPVVTKGKGDDTHLSVDELSMGDRMAVFNWANEAEGVLKPFFPKQAAAMEPA